MPSDVEVLQKREFLIYRVELKAQTIYLRSPYRQEFLIYRVELKGLLRKFSENGRRLWFLIYRVELKVQLNYTICINYIHVPNLPCGVESCLLVRRKYLFVSVFLIYRVELKGLGWSEAFR